MPTLKIVENYYIMPTFKQSFRDNTPKRSLPPVTRIILSFLVHFFVIV